MVSSEAVSSRRVVTSPVPNDGVRVGVGAMVSPLITLDLRVRPPPRIALRTRLEIVSLDRLESSESEDELLSSSSELEEANHWAMGPLADSSSISRCGVDSYMYAWDLSWKAR
jgi:hypothetical protein